MLEIQSLEMKRVLLEEFYMDLFLIIDVFSQNVYLTNYTYIYKRKKQNALTVTNLPLSLSSGYYIYIHSL